MNLRCKMIRIAILDDNDEYLEIIEKQLLKTGLLDSDCNISKYNKVFDFLDELENGKYYDIYFLDVEMPVSNGIDVGKIVRENDSSSIIIYITSYAKFALAAYDAYAFHYILKSRLSEKLPRVLKAALDKIGATKNDYYKIITSTKFEKIRISSIYYVYKQIKYSIFVTEEGRYKERRALAEVLHKLQYKDFTLIDQGVIVNISKINRVLKNEVLLENGEVLMISRNNLKRVKKEIGDYWRKV